MTYLSDIGFNDACGLDRLRTLALMSERGEFVETKAVKYLKLSVGERLELWTKVVGGEPDGNIHAYFVGESRFPVALIEKMPRKKISLSDGAFLCRSKPCAGAGWVAGQIPFVFDAPDYHRYDGLTLPRVAVTQVMGSSRHVVAYESEDEYEEANPPGETGYGFYAMHFLPTYLMEPRSEDGELQYPMAEVSGFVLETDIITNPLTGLDFCWAHVETICGEVDVVCSPHQLEGYLHEGGVVTANCYLYGRILSDDSN
jgi:hypothetical protein